MLSSFLSEASFGNNQTAAPNLSFIQILVLKLTYDSLFHQIYPCSLRLRHISSSCGHTLRFHTETPQLGSEAFVVLSSGCSAPWIRLTCPYSPGRRHSSTGQGCTLSHCSGIRAAHRWELCTSPHRWRPHSHRRRRTPGRATNTCRYDTGSLWRDRPWRLWICKGRQEKVGVRCYDVCHCQDCVCFLGFYRMKMFEF